MPRILVIGDIHGCYAAFETLVASVPVRPDDLLITLGDYVDRGPNTRKVLEWLIARHATGQLIPLRGNHEIMMLNARDGESMHDSSDTIDWLSVGGEATLRSYGNDARLSDVPESHWQFIEHQTRRFYETDTHFFVHANAWPDWPLAEQPDEVIFWEKLRESSPHQSGKIMVCGHTPQRNFLPLNLGHAVCIDTWIYRGGWLTCLNPASGEYWQANQQQETRHGWLDELGPDLVP